MLPQLADGKIASLFSFTAGSATGLRPPGAEQILYWACFCNASASMTFIRRRWVGQRGISHLVASAGSNTSRSGCCCARAAKCLRRKTYLGAWKPQALTMYADQADKLFNERFSAPGSGPRLVRSRRLPFSQGLPPWRTIHTKFRRGLSSTQQTEIMEVPLTVLAGLLPGSTTGWHGCARWVPYAEPRGRTCIHASAALC